MYSSSFVISFSISLPSIEPKFRPVYPLLKIIGSNLGKWVEDLECCIWLGHFFHFYQKFRTLTGRFPSERR
ncbi:unnamed protein product [Coffea canephora]|uniref:Uncharacterized protein n=1 Tax=Coffea canephora TaxID=49390 RepID=A0A068TLK5_COFCA|nr:unnamed protein product [Coffea canephora]